ncbi:hypothetical protein V5O48_011585 [Marasmius crinis-equi]|uniref:5'-Nucleotidase C-terminal domain-containing protein n=1 Tax=Marasmius crinis-equi TaxID=585013 RepID=A0ABR3F553_9AGAR
MAQKDEITFYHFNDVYHVSQPTRIARFAHALRKAKVEDPETLTIFSGDALGPSLEGSVLKGGHIVPVLNHLKIDVACYGNHGQSFTPLVEQTADWNSPNLDFDFGEDRLVELSSECRFPWVLSNAFHEHEQGGLLASAKEFVIRECHGYRIGFFGLAGTDWPSNCQHLPKNTYISSPSEAAQKIARRLRLEESVDLVVAVTHMRFEEDLQVARSTVGTSDPASRVDLILGGHDHEFMMEGNYTQTDATRAQGDIRIVKSGTDFRSYSLVKLVVSKSTLSKKTVIDEVHVEHVPELDVLPEHPEDSTVHSILDSIQQRVSSVSNLPLFVTSRAMEGRGSQIRNFESNLGNMLADAVRAYYNVDVAFVNSGSIRCDRVVEVGVLTVRDAIDILPFDNALLVKQIPALNLLQALENSLSDCRTDGRFLQISGMSVRADMKQPEGSRVLSISLNSLPGKTITHSSTAAELGFSVAVAMTSFIGDGFDGFLCMWDNEKTGVKTVVGFEGAMSDTGLLLQIFRGEQESMKDEGLRRAREAIIVRSDATKLNLPMVDPRIQERIVYYDG